MIQRRRKGAIAECCKEVLRQLHVARLDFGRRMVRLTENHVTSFHMDVRKRKWLER
jgi:hypothetical protein